jgi:hypothetical protein
VTHGKCHIETREFPLVGLIIIEHFFQIGLLFRFKLVFIDAFDSGRASGIGGDVTYLLAGAECTKRRSRSTDSAAAVAAAAPISAALLQLQLGLLLL